MDGLGGEEVPDEGTAQGGEAEEEEEGALRRRKGGREGGRGGLVTKPRIAIPAKTDTPFSPSLPPSLPPSLLTPNNNSVIGRNTKAGTQRRARGRKHAKTAASTMDLFLVRKA